VTDPTKQPGLTIAQVYLVHSSFRHREKANAPSPGAESPVDVQFKTYTRADNKGAAVAVRVRTLPESPGQYDFDVEMVAQVVVEEGRENFPPDDYVAVAGATLLYPFIREYVANLTLRGRFGAVWLKPFNIQAAISTATVEEFQSNDPPAGMRIGDPMPAKQSS
jgi:preprotein translocase subunit SecB